MISPELLMLFATFLSTSCLIWLTDYAESRESIQDEAIIPAAVPTPAPPDQAPPSASDKSEHEVAWNLSPFL